ncbi:ABC transporter substrate-binding protein [Streptomyces sp. SID5910]|uniref:ABC transporter substrate-binding protein n=1 Tax=Streptomyces sp. SID5910 TaxID=2690312 RepID=UPI00136B9E32|nr:ABC transporter substrate-binding protein [Streptomyces sp. SID5910]MYR42353.1 peptide-binding protein [Streptomyces sp. SID5910]
MRSLRLRFLVALLVLTVVAAGGWRWLSQQTEDHEAITVGTTEPVTSLDPAGAYDSGSWALFSNVFQTLLTFDPGDPTPVPDAAERCDFEDEELRLFRCRLRHDITFPSGRTLTAADVKHSFDRVKRINSDVGPTSLFKTLDTVSADTSDTVTFRLSAPDATFPLKVATGAASIVDRQKYPATSLRAGSAVDGTGPYTLSAYTKDHQADLNPNPHYRGYLHETGNPIRLRYYPDAHTLARAWKAQQVDVTSRTLPVDLLAELDPGDPTLRMTASDTAQTHNLYLNTRKSSPLHDARVRRAMAWLVDREALSYTVFRNTVDPLYSVIPSGMTGHTTPFFDDYAGGPNVEKARELLSDAGVSLPVRITFGYDRGRGVGVSTKEAAVLKKQLQTGGLFTVDVTGYQWADFQERWAAGTMDAWAVSWVADYPDPETFGAALVETGSSMNTGYSNAQVDHLVGDTRRLANRGRTADAFDTLQARVARDVPLIPLWQRKDYVVSTPYVGGGQYLQDGTGVFRLWRLRRA